LQPQLMSVDEVLELPNPKPLARIAYGEGPLQFGDLRLPEGPGPHPVLVVIHGGCWRSEYDIDHIGAFSDAIARSGTATWTIEYRRVGDEGGGWPGTFHDVGAAVDHLRVVSQDHSLDLDKVVALGHSAGGHLALWLGGRHKIEDENLRGADPLPLAGIVSLAGVDDLKRALVEGVCDDQAARLVGGTPDEVPERYPVASPIELLPLGVPQHLINGALDPIVPVAFGRSFQQAGQTAGDEIELTVIEDIGHFELIAPTTEAWRAVRDAVAEMIAR